MNTAATWDQSKRQYLMGCLWYFLPLSIKHENIKNITYNEDLSLQNVSQFDPHSSWWCHIKYKNITRKLLLQLIVN